MTGAWLPLADALAVTPPEAPRAAPAAPPAQIAAASDLQAAFTEVGKAFADDGHGAVAFTFGASGLLAKQLAQGAPFDAFAAANEAFIDDVVRAGACDGGTKTRYGRGHIVVWTRNGASRAHDARVAPPTSLADLARPRFRHVAIANPETAPYGAAAKQALVAAGVWDALAPRIVYGENVRQTLQLAQTGNADAAIVALSLAIPAGGVTLAVDEELHTPLVQAAAACTRGRSAASGAAFVRYLATPRARAILERFGFATP